MAYHSTSGLASNTSDALTKLKTFLTVDCGWTLWDDQMGQAQPYFVVYSAGESGKEDIYLQFIDDATLNKVSVKGALYWNPATHMAVKPVFVSDTTAFLTSDSVPFNYWFFVSLDRVFIVTRLGANYFCHYSGIIKRFWSDEIATTQGDVNSGTNVVVSVNDASILTPGKYYIIKDNANIARVQVTAMDIESTPNHATIATLATGYSAGAKLGEDPQPVIVGNSNLPGCQFLNRYDGYASQSGHSGNVREFSGYQAGNTDPDCRYHMVAMFPIFVTCEPTGWEEVRGELIDVYCIGSGAGASEDVIDLGTSTYKIFNYTGSIWLAVRE